MNKGIYSLFALFFVAILTGCASQQSAAPATVINQKVTVNQQISVRNLPQFDLTKEINKLKNDRELVFLCGESANAGIWVVCRVDLYPEERGNNNELLTRAAIIAKRDISEWIGTTQSGKTSLQTAEKIVDDQSVIEQKLKSRLVSESQNFLRAVTIHSYKDSGKVFSAYFYATSQTADRSRELEAQLRALPPGVVRAIGLADISGRKVALAKRNAVANALQDAVEQVMGTTVIAQSKLMDNVKAKSKVIAQTVGSVKQYRIVSEGTDAQVYRVIVNAQVDEAQLLDNYAAIVRSMGNPAFFISINDPDLHHAMTDFFIKLGIKVTGNEQEAEFIVSGNCQYPLINDSHYGEGIQIDFDLILYNARTKRQLLSLRNQPRLSSTYSGTVDQIRRSAAAKAFRSMRKELHGKLNKIIMDWVLNGRDVEVVMHNVPTELSTGVWQELIEAVPCAKLHSQTRNGSTVKLQCSYVGSSADFEDFIRERFKRDLQGVEPKTEKIDLREIVFSL